MNIILIIFALSLDSAAVRPAEPRGLLKWNLFEADLRYSLPVGDHPGPGARYQLLEMSMISLRHRAGLGTALFEYWGDASTSMSHFAVLPVQLKILVWRDEKGFFSSPFVPMVNVFMHFSFIPIPNYDTDYAADLGLEYTPGFLLNLRAGYVLVPRTKYSAFYVSAGLFLGAVHKIK